MSLNGPGADIHKHSGYKRDCGGVPKVLIFALKHPATEVTLSPKRAKRRTRGPELHSTEAKARGGRACKTRADLERQLKASRQEIARGRERLAEATMQQNDASEMLRLIANSPIQSVPDAVAEHAARLCDAGNVRIWRLEGNLLRLVASYGEGSATMDGREGLPVNRDTVTGRAAYDRRAIHVHDIAAEDGEYPVGGRLVKDQGWRTVLATPLLREGAPIGTILVRRMEVRPFSDKQIALLETFADHAVIAIENARLFEAEKQRTLALARSEMHLAAAQRLSQTGSFSWKPSTGERLWSDEIYRIFDIDPASGPDLERAFERVHPDQRDHVRRLSALVANGDASIDEIFRLSFPDGSSKFIHQKSRALRGDDGKFEVVGAVADITKVKAVEDALRENEQNLQALVETIPALVWRAKPDGQIDYVSKRVLQYLGSPLEEIIGWGWLENIHPDDVTFKVQRWLDSLEAVNSHEANCRFRRFDGAYRWFNVRGEPLRDSGGRVLNWYGVLIDVDDQKKAEEASRESELNLREVQAELTRAGRITTLGQFTASIAHEVRQPIGSARNNAVAALNFLDRPSPNLGEVKEALKCIVANADRAGHIVDRIRDHIKKAPPRRESFDLNEAINEVLLLAQSAITVNEISLQTRFAEELLIVHGDRVQLQQVVLNLILNAVEAMASVEAVARHLLIHTKQNRADEVLVAICDTGPGIEPDHLERVFDAFYTTKSNGVGMGLSICRSIIGAQGGRLWAEANKPRGTVFQFALPNTENS
jgi:PAS domain S-box-containing protein